MTPAPVHLITSERCLLHVPPPGHVERPDRLSAILARFASGGLLRDLLRIEAEPAEDDVLARVHTRDHIGRLREVCARGGGMLDEGDTFAVQSSFEAAARAAGGAVRAVDAVLGGAAPSAFCAVRPPGHHAERDRAMGFCLFNTAAVAARHAQEVHGTERVAILDWDVHHGNGTQHIFEDDPTVLYCSLHQYPFYPGTGAASERGTGKGEGATINIPLPAGSGEPEYLRAFGEVVLPALARFRPGLLIISAGFDAHREDPLGGMLLEDASFARFTRMLRETAPVVSVLEGGYDLGALARSAEHHVRALLHGGGTGEEHGDRP
jgi:acetoin utilization deacetylase AcuC-like enzyme